MAKESKSQYIDVDRTVLEPSPQRVRNILTLEERVRAIQAYDCRPMYTKVAKMFNCSWEQIKNILANRDAIMEFYEATKNLKKNTDPTEDDIRQRKIAFLGECMYEYIQRSQYHTRVDLTEELIRMKAIEFRDVIQIENFTPHKVWINHFKATYNFSLSNRQIVMTRTPPASLSLKDIMTYCTTNKAKVPQSNPSQPPVKNLYRTTTKMSVTSANNATLEELIQRRQRKITFLEKALYEYMQRAQYHHKMPLNEDLLRKVACELKEMLKIDNFYPNKSWFNQFKKRFDFCFSQGSIVITGTPPLSLDLKDILSYCSRHDNRNQMPSTITLAPKEPPQRSFMTAIPISTLSAAKSPNATLRLATSPIISAPKYPPGSTAVQKIKEEIIDLDDEEIDVKPNVSELPVRGQTTPPKDDVCQAPPLKIKKIESMCDDFDPHEAHNSNNMHEQGQAQASPLLHSPGHWSEHSDDSVEGLPTQVRSYEDALKLLKPLEEFAMLEENYRVIGLLSQLEDIFKNSPARSND